MHTQRLVVLLASLLSCALAAEFLEAEWQSWKGRHERKYESKEEEVLRRERWEETWKKVKKHNKLADQGKKSYRMALNHFADRTSYELQSMSCLRIPVVRQRSTSKYSGVSLSSLPPQVDWRDQRCVTAVKDQGRCGSCWAFAAVGALESRYCIKTGELFEMSEQELVDCDSEDGGCCGGFPYSAFKYIYQHGIMPSNKYKYKGYGGDCRLKHSKTVPMNMSKFYELSGEDNMAAAVAYDGPITVGFGVTDTFFYYSEGIYDEEDCPDANHAIIIVGYGEEDHEGYWIIKNSWGHYWGDRGYAKIRRNSNICTIGDMGSVMDLL
ncbi:cathepsin K-like [Lissotriton helveticus]